jgi:truncated hemoglobin YjbI
MVGNRTDEQEVKEVMQSLQGADLAKVAIVYETLYGQTLIDAIKGDFSCGLEKTYVSQIEGAMKLSQKDSNATISEVEIDNYIHMLNKAMNRAGTDENTVSDIINSLSPKNLKLVMEAYKKEYGTSLRKHINDDFSGDAQQLLFAKLDKAAEYEEESEKDENKIISDSKAQYYAESLNTAMKGCGTDEEAIKTIMKKLKGEDLKKVLDVYEDIYGTSLKKHLKDDLWNSPKLKKKYVKQIEEVE